MSNNKLKLNDDKTHLLIMTTQQKRRLVNIDIQIDTPNEVIRPIKTEKLLGINIQDNLKWTEYIQNSDKSLIKQLTSRLNAMKMLSGVASFKTRLMVANGIFCSKLIYQICLWGGTEDYLLNSLQIIQNKAARCVTKRGIYTPVTELMKQCGWLNVRQLVFYHSVVLIHKTLRTGFPNYIYNKLEKDFPYHTRLASSESIRMGSQFRSKLTLTENSFMNRATSSYNLLPATMRQLDSMEVFKKRLKPWILETI